MYAWVFRHMSGSKMNGRQRPFAPHWSGMRRFRNKAATGGRGNGATRVEWWRFFGE
jgi:hypothetical protein